MIDVPTILYRYSATPVYCNKKFIRVLYPNCKCSNQAKENIEEKMLQPGHLAYHSTT